MKEAGLTSKFNPNLDIVGEDASFGHGSVTEQLVGALGRGISIGSGRGAKGSENVAGSDPIRDSLHYWGETDGAVVLLASETVVSQL